MTEPDWSAYQRCPVCFRAWDCRSLRRGKRRTVRHLVSIEGFDGFVVRYQYLRLEGVAAGWYDRTLKHPHRGRKKKV